MKNDPSIMVNLIETFLNRSAILSQMKRYDKAVETLKKALKQVISINTKDGEVKK